MARMVRGAKPDESGARQAAGRRDQAALEVARARSTPPRLSPTAQGPCPGGWIVRRWVGNTPECTNGYRKTTLRGIADDFQDADGRSILSFADAQKAAYDHAEQATAAPPAPEAPTVREVVDNYVSYLRIHKKTADKAIWRAEAFVLPVLGNVRIDRLTLKELEDWRDGLLAAPARLRTPKAKEAATRPAANPSRTGNRRSSAPAAPR